MKNLKHFFILILLAVLSVSGLTCDEEELAISMSYREMLDQAYNETGEGRIIPVTIENAVEIDGSISTKGQYLFYASNSDRGNYDIYLRSMRDITTIKIIGHASSDYSPAISPNGKYLAFVSEREDPEGDIYVVRVKSNSLIKKAREAKESSSSLDDSAENISQLVEKESGMKKVVRDAAPAWSPDSDLIAFSSVRNGLENIFLCERDGDKLVQLTTDGGMSPQFSSDGKKIVYISYNKPENNGDIYSIDIETKEVTQVTNTLAIELNPTFVKDSNKIIYTLIDKDTNKDKKLDLNDKSVIQYADLITKHSYALTFYSNSSFSPRWFPFYSLQYKESKAINFDGVIVYAQQVGNNIDLNMIPEYGVIPKRESAKEQYETALKYLNEYNDFDRYTAALMRVYYFFANTTDENSKIYIARALRDLALNNYRNKNKSRSKENIELLNTLNGESTEEDYITIVREFLKLRLTEKGAGTYLEEAYLRSKGKTFAAYLLEDLADYSRQEGKKSLAIKQYQELLVSYPDYPRKYYIHEFLGQLTYTEVGDMVTDHYIKILNSGTHYQQDSVVRSLIHLFENKLTPSRRFEKSNLFQSLYETKDDRSSKILTSLFIYLKQIVAFQQTSKELSKRELKDALDKIDSESVLYYTINKLLADIALREKNLEEEEQYLSEAANSYLERWKQNDLDEVVLRLINIYENKGLAYEKKGEYRKAVIIYKGYTAFLSNLKNKRIKKFENIYNEYGARSHILYIDAYFQSKGSSRDGLNRLKKAYEDGAVKARKNFDKAHIFGLGYLYSRIGLFLDKEYQERKKIKSVAESIDEKKEKEFNSEEIAQNFYNSVATLNWSLFMDDEFSDSYLLKGWVYQYVEYRRDYENSKNNDLGKYLDQYFPNYLLEANIDTYEKSLRMNNELKYPEKEGNIHLNLANTYFMLVNYTEAIKHYKAASKYKHSFASKKQEAFFSFHLAYCYYQIGDHETARQELKKVSLIYSDLSGGLVKKQYSRAFLYVMKYNALFSRLDNDFEDTIKWYNQILSLAAKFNIDIDRSRYHQEIANCYIELKNYKQAFSHINRAERINNKDDSREFKEHNLDFQWLWGRIPLPVFDLGDSAVIGDARLYRGFDLFTKKLYSLTLKEKIYYSKGDYRSVIKIQKMKLKLLTDKERIIHNEVRLRTLNNLGHAHFILNDYKTAETYFNQAWKFANSIGDSNGIFISIQNLTSLYSFIQENDPGFYKEPVKVINSLILEIDKYIADYEKSEYKIRLAKIEETKKVKGLEKATPEEKVALKQKIKSDAQTKYFKLNISKATLNFYKAELLYASYYEDFKTGVKSESAVYTSNKNIFDYYNYSAGIFASASENSSINLKMKLKLMLNSTICRQKLGQINEAYSILENALTVSEKNHFDEISFLIYYKQAQFIEEHAKELGISFNKAVGKYEQAYKIIKEVPQLFYNKEQQVNKFYDHYTLHLIEKKQYEKALYLQEVKRSFNLLNIAYLSSPQFFDITENELYNNFKTIINSISRLKEQYSKAMIKYGREKDDKVEIIKKQLDTALMQYKSLNYENILLQKLIKHPENISYSGDNVKVYNFLKNEDKLYVWEVVGTKIKFESILLNAAPLRWVINQYLLKNSNESSILYLIYNKTIEALYEEPIVKTSEEKSAQFMYICSLQDLQLIQNSSKSLNSSIYIVSKEIKDEDPKADLVKYSVIYDKKSSYFDLAGYLFTKRIKPSLMIKDYQPDSVQKKHYLFYASLYTGTSNLVVQNDLSDIKADTTLYSGKTSFQELNALVSDSKLLFAMGRNGTIAPKKEEFTEIATSLFNAFQKSLLQGNSDNARFYLFRWYEAVKGTPGIEYEYALNLAELYDFQLQTMSAVSVLESIDYKKIEDKEVATRLISSRLYYLIKAGKVNLADTLLNEIAEVDVEFSKTDDYNYYKSFITTIKNYSSEITSTNKISVQEYKTALLAARYLSLLGYKSKAALEAGKVRGTNRINADDLLFINSFSELKSLTITDNRVLTTMGLRTSESFENLQKSYNSAIEVNGLYDTISKFTVMMSLNRMPELLSSHRTAELIPTSSIMSIAKEGLALDKINFLVITSDHFKEINDYKTCYELLNFAISQCEAEGINFYKEFLYYKLAQSYAEVSDYSQLASIVTNIDSVNKTNVYFNKMALLRAESLSADNEYEQSNEILKNITAQGSNDEVILTLISILNQYLQISDEGLELTLFTSTSKNKFDTVIKQLRSNQLLLKNFKRLNLFNKVADLYIKAEYRNGNNQNAIMYSEIKKQIDYLCVKPNFKTDKSIVLNKQTRLFLDGIDVVHDISQTRKLLPKSSVIIYVERIEADLLIWLISENNVENYLITNGFRRYAEYTEMYENNLLSIYNMSSVASGYTSLFSNILDKLKDYKNIQVVSPQALEYIPFEIMGEIPLIEEHNFTLLPALSVYSDTTSVKNNSLIILAPETVTTNDELEQLAIKESGVLLGNESNSSLSHIQQNLYWEPVVKSYILNGKPYHQSIKKQFITYISSNNAVVEKSKNFILINFLLGNRSIILNRTLIRDVNSAIVVREFYSSLKSEKNYKKGFNDALRRVYFNARFSHPSFWSKTRLYSMEP